MSKSIKNTKESFEDFLKRKSSEEKINWRKRKIDYVNSINLLYKEIENWLKPYKNKNLLDIKRIEIKISEEHIEDYKIDYLEIFIGNNNIRLYPIGTEMKSLFIKDSYGKIIMYGPKGEFILVLDENHKWKFTLRSEEIYNVCKESFKHSIQKLF